MTSISGQIAAPSSRTRPHEAGRVDARFQVVDLMLLVALIAATLAWTTQPLVMVCVVLIIHTVFVMCWWLWLLCLWPRPRPATLSGLLAHALGIAATLNILGFFGRLLLGYPAPAFTLTHGVTRVVPTLESAALWITIALAALWLASAFVWIRRRIRRGGREGPRPSLAMRDF